MSRNSSSTKKQKPTSFNKNKQSKKASPKSRSTNKLKTQSNNKKTQNTKTKKDDHGKEEFIPHPPNVTSGENWVRYFDKPIMNREKSSSSHLSCPDQPDFKPDYTPLEVFEAGAFGGSYFRTINSQVAGKQLKAGSIDAVGGLPKNLFKSIQQSPKYDTSKNKYKAYSGASLEDWENSGWIKPVDPYGWFQWYCRFYYGRRCYDDRRQIGRWLSFIGRNGGKTQAGWKQGLLHWAKKAIDEM